MRMLFLGVKLLFRKYLVVISLQDHSNPIQAHIDILCRCCFQIC